MAKSKKENFSKHISWKEAFGSATAKKLKIKTVSILGNKGGKAKKLSDNFIIVDSSNIASIQEAHIFLGHFLIDELEKKLFD